MAATSSSPARILLCLAILLGVAAAAPGGSRPAANVRGDRWVCTLTGAQVSPPNSSLAVGRGEIQLRGNRILARFSWSGLSGRVMGLHIHMMTAAGAEGAVLFDIVPGRIPAGARSPVEAEFYVDHAQQELMRAGRMYADLHTRVYPGGEIRGWIVSEPAE